MINSLRRELYQRIKATGPLTVASMMTLVSSHPTLGYYTAKRDILGPKGDFTTSPEISPLFGMSLSLFLINYIKRWDGPVHIVELGPGNGTLMNDVLHTMNQFPFLHDRIERVSLIDQSTFLKENQMKLLGKWKSCFPSLNLESIPLSALTASHPITFIISNEFFDALPIHILGRKGSVDGGSGAGVDRRWRDLLVDGIDYGEDIKFRLIGDAVAGGAREECCTEFMEVSPETERISLFLIEELLKKSTNSLFITADYGYSDCEEVLHRPTLRAIRDHKILSSPFESLGESDLSADVSFGRLERLFKKERMYTSKTIEQGVFLETIGIKQLCSKLGSSGDLVNGMERLIDPDKMGRIYKFFISSPQSL